MKLSSQTIILSVALAAASVTTSINASDRVLVRNRKKAINRNRNLIKVDESSTTTVLQQTTSLEEIVQINDNDFYRKLGFAASGDMMSMSMPNGSSSGSGDSGGNDSSGDSSGKDSSSSGDNNNESDSSSSTDGGSDPSSSTDTGTGSGTDGTGTDGTDGTEQTDLYQHRQVH